MNVRSSGFAALTALFTLMGSSCTTVTKVFEGRPENKMPVELNGKTYSRYDHRFEQDFIINKYEPNTVRRDTTVTESRPWASDLTYRLAVEHLQTQKDIQFKRNIEETARNHLSLEQNHDAEMNNLQSQNLNNMSSLQALQHSQYIETREIAWAMEHRKHNSWLAERLLDASRWYAMGVTALDNQFLSDPVWRARQTRPQPEVTYMRMIEDTGRDQAQRGGIEATQQESRKNGWNFSKLFGPTKGEDPAAIEAARADSAAAAGRAVADSLAAAEKISLGEAYADSVAKAFARRETADAAFREGFRSRASDAISKGQSLQPDDVSKARDLGMFSAGPEKAKLQESVIDALLPVVRVYETANRDSAMTNAISEKYRNALEIAQVSGLGKNYVQDFRKDVTAKIVSIAGGKGGELSEKEVARAKTLGMFEGKEGAALQKSVGDAYQNFLEFYNLNPVTDASYEAHGRAKQVVELVGRSVGDFSPATPSHVPAPAKGP